jgi:glycosyltransferase involved in cell wall biosynthesis
VPAPVSVILPLYNKAAYIRRALDSIAGQTYPDFEVLIVNDGSSDGSETIAAGYPDPRFRVIHQANAGPGAARNRGIAEARGEWVAFLDADDEWNPDFLMRSLEVAEDQGPVAAVTSSYFEYPAVTSTTPMWLQRGIRNGRQSCVPA